MTTCEGTWRVVLGLSMTVMMIGCAHVVVPPNAPVVPAPPSLTGENTASFLPELQLSQSSPSPKPGTALAQTFDGVTLRVVRVLDNAISTDASYVLSVKGLDERDYEVSLFPRAVVFRLENNTAHNLTLGRTSMLVGSNIELRDQDGSVVPIVASVEDARRRTHLQVADAFSNWLSVSGAVALHASPEWQSECEKTLDTWRSLITTGYSGEFDKFSQEVNAYLSKGYQISTPEMSREDTCFTAEGLRNLLTELQPDAVLAAGERQYADSIKNAIRSSSGVAKVDSLEVSRRKQQALAKIDGLRVSEVVYEVAPTAAMTVESDNSSGGWRNGLIMIGPGQAKEITVPFMSDEKRQVTELQISVSDVPTVFDSAGAPTRRTTFKFHVLLG